MKNEKITGLVCSSFDLLHAGHMLMLKDAKGHCHKLVVGLQIDPSVTDASYRGKKKQTPILSIDERRIILDGIKYIDEVFEYETEEDLYEIIKSLEPHLRILGSDWEGKHATAQEFADGIYYHKRNHDYSTTRIKERITERLNSI